MDALTLLDRQHDDITALFIEAERARGRVELDEVFARLGDALAIRTEVEESILFPALSAYGLRSLLLERLRKHLILKGLIENLLDDESAEAVFVAKLAFLQEQFEQCVAEEQRDLWPHARDLLDDDTRALLGQEMEARALELAGTEPRYVVRDPDVELLDDPPTHWRASLRR
jgi:hypothetical protein